MLAVTNEEMDELWKLVRVGTPMMSSSLTSEPLGWLCASSPTVEPAAIPAVTNETRCGAAFGCTLSRRSPAVDSTYARLSKSNQLCDAVREDQF